MGKRKDLRELQDSFEGMRDVTERAIVASEEATGIADAMITLAAARRAEIERLHDLVRGKGDKEALDSDQLIAFAGLDTGWSVSSTVGGGTATKVFSKTLPIDEMIPERREGGELARDTYLSLADYEHSHLQLAQIFGTYGISGERRTDHYQISIETEEPGPITYGDLSLMLDAEALLFEQGYTGAGSAAPNFTAA